MYDNYLFVLIYGLFVCMYVTCPSKVGMSFLLCMQTNDITYTHNVPAPPVGGLGGGLTICSHV